jgi:hypothetical protein
MLQYLITVNGDDGWLWLYQILEQPPKPSWRTENSGERESTGRRDPCPGIPKKKSPVATAHIACATKTQWAPCESFSPIHPFANDHGEVNQLIAPFNVVHSHSPRIQWHQCTFLDTNSPFDAETTWSNFGTVKIEWIMSSSNKVKHTSPGVFA